MSEFNSNQYKAQWAKENQERISLVVRKGQRDKIKARADALGKSTNQYILDCIQQEMARSGWSDYAEDQGTGGSGTRPNAK
jgi:hypothetical protein